MTERKFTDEDIIKALECCAVDPHSGKFSDCKNCPLDHSKTANCFEYEIQIIALDLINRQRAEIEKWQLAYDCADSALRELSVTRSEAIKEFAERLKKRLERKYTTYGREYVLRHLRELVKEMTEGKQ